MGPKKKGKGNKLARMSEEERIRYLQHRAAIEEEARRRKEQLISIFLKKKLKREEGFSRLNMAKINQQWRQTLRQIKCVELKQDLHDLLKWFDYTANKKNKMIETLLADLDEAECQHSRIHQCQMETIDRLTRIHKQRIDHFYRQFLIEKDNIYRKANADLTDIKNSFLADEEHLQTILYKMEETFAEKTAAMTSRHASKVDELRNNMLTEMENLKNSRESQIESIWQNFEKVLKQYWDLTEDRRKQYIIMRDTDYENCKQIFENNQQINMTIDLIKSLKNQLARVITTSHERIVECKAVKENSRQVLYTLKKNVSKEVEKDKKNLYYMNSVAGKATEELKRISSKGEQILQLQSLCRKYETMNEKICPEGHDKSQLTEEEEQKIQEQYEELRKPVAEKFCNEFDKLDGFWKRYNRALIEKEALGLHYQSLLKEQEQLKSTLKSYLSDYVVKRPELKVSYANGVQIIRQRPFTSVPTERKFPFSVVTCIEATQSPSIRQIINAEIKKSCR